MSEARLRDRVRSGQERARNIPEDTPRAAGTAVVAHGQARRKTRRGQGVSGQGGLSAVARSEGVKQRQRLRLETPAQMLERLTNPVISLHEASVLLGVCTATVRRYTASGILPHARTPGGQRRFRLRDVLALERDRKTKRR